MVYDVLEKVVADHHQRLVHAKIALAYRMGCKPDVDGRHFLGATRRGGDLDRDLHGYDFVLVLNHEFINQVASPGQIEALFDHLLCRCEVAKDRNGEPKTDTKDRTVYRLRKPDIVEFTEVVARRGSWTVDLERLLRAWKENKARPLLPAMEYERQTESPSLT